MLDGITQTLLVGPLGKAAATGLFLLAGIGAAAVAVGNAKKQDREHQRQIDAARDKRRAENERIRAENIVRAQRNLPLLIVLPDIDPDTIGLEGSR